MNVIDDIFYGKYDVLTEWYNSPTPDELDEDEMDEDEDGGIYFDGATVYIDPLMDIENEPQFEMERIFCNAYEAIRMELRDKEFPCSISDLFDIKN